MADEELLTEEAPAEEQAKGSKMPLLLILVVLLALGGGAYWWFVLRPAGTKTPARQTPKIKSTLHLDGFVVNLADPDGNHYLRVGIELGLGKEPPSSKEKGAPDPTPAIRDAILGALSTCQSDVLLSPDGKTK